MLRGCSIACTRLTILLASFGGDHLPAEPDEVAAWASISVISPRFVVCGTEFPSRLIGAEANRSFRLPSTRHRRGRVSGFAGSKCERNKKKGAPTCAGAPQRSWHCRVCARTGVVGAAPKRHVPGEPYML